jgi:hypothetical protein
MNDDGEGVPACVEPFVGRPRDPLAAGAGNPQEGPGGLL